MQESRPRPFDIDHAGHVISVRGTRNFFAIGIADGGIARGGGLHVPPAWIYQG